MQQNRTLTVRFTRSRVSCGDLVKGVVLWLNAFAAVWVVALHFQSALQNEDRQISL